jgi:hypothetical protein
MLIAWVLFALAVIPLSGRVGELLGSGCGRWKRVLVVGVVFDGGYFPGHDDGAASRLAPQPLACPAD